MPVQTPNSISNDDFTIPGTVRLVDVEHELRTRHAGRDSDIVLVPAPSVDDPDDPLNWSTSRKALAATCQSVYTITVGIASAAIYSVLEPISEDTGLPLSDLNAGTGYMFLAFGWGCLVWQPLALKYGKRPAYLLSMIATLAIMVWTPYTSTVSQYLASKVLQGFFGAPIESLVEISVADVWFQHERGRYIGLYAFSLAGSSYFAPIIAGFIAEGQGWPWVFFWCAMFLGVGFIFNVLAMEETNYFRVYPTPIEESRFHERSDKEVSLHQSSEEDVSRSTNDPGTNGKKGYLQKLSLLAPSQPVNFWKMVPRPLMLLRFPVIAWAGFSYGSALVWFNVLNGTASSILSANPYDFAPSIVGLAYISPFIGICLSSWGVGRLSDWMILKIARHNGGIVEPEHRLWLFTVNVVLTPMSLILWGVGAAHGVHWFGLVLSMGITAATNCIGIQLSVLYAIDSYKELSGEALVTVILIRNTMSFAINYGLTPWVTNMGEQNAFILAAFAGLAQALSFLIMVKWGRAFRARSKERYYTYISEGREIGMGR